MRDKWYGDQRDLVKWSVLLILSEKYKAVKIIQVAYYRKDEWDKTTINIDGEECTIPDSVIRHFRNVDRIQTIATTPTIEIVKDVFANRDGYNNNIVANLNRIGPERHIIFLDPDTGLEPVHPNHNHVLELELRDIWDAIKIGDVLVFYQHQTNRNGTDWIEPKRKQFERAIRLKTGRVKVAKGNMIARDVVFFFIQKTA